MGGSFDDAQMALHDAANACVCGGHVAVMEVSGLLDGGGLVEATAATAELLVAEHCRCSDVCGYLQGLSRSSNVFLRGGNWLHNSQWEKSSNQTGSRWQFPRWTQC